MVSFGRCVRPTVYKPTTPEPSPDLDKGDEQLREKVLGRNAVFILIISLGGAFLVSSLITAQPAGVIYNQEIGAKIPKGPVNQVYTAEDFAKHWPWLSGASTNPCF